MTYHTVLRRPEDFIMAMESASIIAENITNDINEALLSIGRPTIEVFAYRQVCKIFSNPKMSTTFTSFSPFYVFYEQYHDIVKVAIMQILFSLASIFCVTTVLLGVDPWSGFIVISGKPMT